MRSAIRRLLDRIQQYRFEQELISLRQIVFFLFGQQLKLRLEKLESVEVGGWGERERETERSFGDEEEEVGGKKVEWARCILGGTRAE